MTAHACCLTGRPHLSWYTMVLKSEETSGPPVLRPSTMVLAAGRGGWDRVGGCKACDESGVCDQQQGMRQARCCRLLILLSHQEHGNWSISVSVKAVRHAAKPRVVG
jgi:hypothetical protein